MSDTTLKDLSDADIYHITRGLIRRRDHARRNLEDCEAMLEALLPECNRRGIDPGHTFRLDAPSGKSADPEIETA